MKILILEDEVIIAESLFQLLALLEYDPLEPVSTPEEAMEALQLEQPQLAILDLRLQNNRNGLEVAEYIRNNKLSIPFIILTAHSDAETINKVKKFKPAAYLVKPFSRESLFVAIEMATGADSSDEIPDAEETDSQDGELFIKTGSKHERINIREIMLLRAQGKYTEMQFENTKRLIRMSLTSFTESFHQVPWLRVHKSFVVNPSFVTSIKGDELELGKLKVPVGRFFQPNVEEFFLASHR